MLNNIYKKYIMRYYIDNIYLKYIFEIYMYRW
jgi:hypothetical protein